MKRASHEDSTLIPHNQSSNPGPPDPTIRCLPLDHDATLLPFVYFLVGKTSN